MIQRIQSLYLFIGAALLSACLFMPIWKWAGSPKYSITLDAFGISLYHPDMIYIKFPFIGIGLIVSILVSLYIILQFKNRRRQMTLTLLNALLIFGVIGIMYWGATAAEAQISPTSQIKGDYTIAFFFPAIAAMLNLLAMRSIKKDEELVRSADRIR